MPELSHIDPRSAALLVMDYQVDTFTRFMIWIIVWLSSAIAAPTQMQRCMRCCSTSSSRSRRPSSPWRSSPAPCLAGLHERTRAIELSGRRAEAILDWRRLFEVRGMHNLDP